PEKSWKKSHTTLSEFPPRQLQVESEESRLNYALLDIKKNPSTPWENIKRLPRYAFSNEGARRR
ncbi:hypothetical protein BGZ49_005072, partial [Haplosporangium sp. Z 27]